MTDACVWNASGWAHLPLLQCVHSKRVNQTCDLLCFIYQLTSDQTLMVFKVKSISEIYKFYKFKLNRHLWCLFSIKKECQRFQRREHETWFLHNCSLNISSSLWSSIVESRLEMAKLMWLWGRASFSKWLNSSWPWGAVKNPLLIINNSNGLLIANPIEISDVSMLLIHPHANDKDVSLHCSLTFTYTAHHITTQSQCTVPTWTYFY